MVRDILQLICRVISPLMLLVCTFLPQCRPFEPELCCSVHCPFSNSFQGGRIPVVGTFCLIFDQVILLTTGSCHCNESCISLNGLPVMGENALHQSRDNIPNLRIHLAMMQFHTLCQSLVLWHQPDDCLKVKSQTEILSTIQFVVENPCPLMCYRS